VTPGLELAVVTNAEAYCAATQTSACLSSDIEVSSVTNTAIATPTELISLDAKLLSPAEPSFQTPAATKWCS